MPGSMEPSADARIGDVDVWVFDLDNTLYHARYNQFTQVEQRMNPFVATALKLDGAEARRLQTAYYHAHGSTLRGLMLLHGTDPDEFLDYVHDIDVTWLPPNGELDSALARLNGRKVVFTSGSTDHADRVMRRLGVRHHIEAVFDIAAADYVPKPNPETYRRFVARHAIVPERAIMFDDIARNLEPAAALGMKTVWIRNDEPYGHEGAEGDHIHHVTDDLVAWLEENTG